MLLIKERIAKAFDPAQANALNELVDLHNELVKASDSTELKSIVKDLARALGRRIICPNVTLNGEKPYAPHH